MELEKISERIDALQAALLRARQYLESGQHADWSEFRPLFAPRTRDGLRLPPHEDWVRSVFIPRQERALRSAERALERLEWSPLLHRKLRDRSRRALRAGR